MRESLKFGLSVALAVLLLSMIGSPVGTAAAAENGTTSEHDCGDLERAAVYASFGYGELALDCFEEADTVNDTLQQQEVHTEMYTIATSQSGKGKILTTTQANYLNDTRTNALQIGRKAYVDYLENESNPTEAEALIAAKSAVNDYYAVKQVNLARMWEAETVTMDEIVTTAEANEYLGKDDVLDKAYWDSGTYSGDDWQTNPNYNGVQETSSELLNGSSVTYTSPIWHYSSNQFTMKVNTMDGQGSRYTDIQDAKENQSRVWASADVKPPSTLEDSSDNVRMLKAEDYVRQWNRIEEQATSTNNNLEDFVSGSYDQVQNGELTPDDLVDPYLGARNFDPDTNTSSWAMRSLLSLGLSPPQDAESYGNMTIRNETSGTEHVGLLLSDGTPESGSFTVGETYNAANLEGSQFVASPVDGQVRLEGNFTLVAAETPGGTAYGDGEKIKYKQDVNYKTADLTEYKNAMENATRLLRVIEERENNMGSGGGNSGGGGVNTNGFDWNGLTGSLPFGGAGLVVVLGAFAVLSLVTRN